MMKKLSSTGEPMEVIPKDWTPAGGKPEDDDEY